MQLAEQYTVRKNKAVERANAQIEDLKRQLTDQNRELAMARRRLRELKQQRTKLSQRVALGRSLLFRSHMGCGGSKEMVEEELLHLPLIK